MRTDRAVFPQEVYGTEETNRAVAKSGIKRTNREIEMDVKRSQLSHERFFYERYTTFDASFSSRGSIDV